MDTWKYDSLKNIKSRCDKANLQPIKWIFIWDLCAYEYYIDYIYLFLIAKTTRANAHWRGDFNDQNEAPARSVQGREVRQDQPQR
jgi:hypothetical protein